MASRGETGVEAGPSGGELTFSWSRHGKSAVHRACVGRHWGHVASAEPGSICKSGYTRSVSWRHRIAAVLLTVLAGLPVSGTVCAMVCDSASTAAAAHHGSGQKCEEPARAASGPQVVGHTEHDCSTHDAAVRHATMTAAERADLTTKSAPLMIGVVQIESATLHDSRTFFDYSSPPGTAPPTTTPLVLRV